MRASEVDSSLPRRLGGSSVETELVALNVLHHNAGLVLAIGTHRAHMYRAKLDQPCTFGFKCGQTLLTHEPATCPNVKMQPVLDNLPFRNTLEEHARTHTRGVTAREIDHLILRRQRAMVVLPSGKPCWDRRYDVTQHLGPEAGKTHRVRAIEGHLDLLDR